MVAQERVERVVTLVQNIGGEYDDCYRYFPTDKVGETLEVDTVTVTL